MFLIAFAIVLAASLGFLVGHIFGFQSGRTEGWTAGVVRGYEASPRAEREVEEKEGERVVKEANQLLREAVERN